MIAALKEKYPNGDVLKSFSAHVRTTLASMTEIGEKLGVSALLSDVANQESIPSGSHDGELDLDDLSSFFEKTTSGLVQNALAGLTEETPVEEPAVVEVTETPTETVNGESKTETAAPVAAQTNGAKLDLISDYKELEALVAESTSNYVKTTLHGLSAVPYQPTVPQSTGKQSPACGLVLIFQSYSHEFSRDYGCAVTLSEPSASTPIPSPLLHYLRQPASSGAATSSTNRKLR